MKKLYFLLLVLMMFGCTSKANHHDPPDAHHVNGNEIPIVRLVSDLNSDDLPRSPVAIQEVRLDGDFLHLEVSYSGGCEAHELELVASRHFMESYPVQTTLLLTHDANRDYCEALIICNLTYDLSSIKELYQQMYQQTSGTVILRLNNWSENLNYTF